MDRSNYNRGGSSAGRGRGGGSGVGRGRNGGGGNNYQQHHQGQYQSGGLGGRGGGGRGGAQMGTNPPPAQPSGYCQVQGQSGAQRQPAVVGQGVGPTSGRGAWSRGPPVSARGSWANTIAAGAGAGQAQKRDPKPLPDPEGKDPPRRVGLVNYFREKYGKDIMYQDIPCLDVGKNNRKNQILMEFCILVEGQRYPKENLDKKEALLLKDISLAPAVERKNTICQMVRAEDAPCGGDIIRNFGIGVDMNMTSAVGRVIGPPDLNVTRGADEDAVSSFGIIFNIFKIIDVFNCCFI